MRVTTIRELLVEEDRFMVAPRTTLAEAFDTMSALATGALYVADEGVLMGTVTEADVIRHVSQYGGLHAVRVMDIMRIEPEWVETRGSLAEAAGIMASNGYVHLPVLDLTGKLAGILMLADIPPHYLAGDGAYFRATSAAAH